MVDYTKLEVYLDELRDEGLSYMSDELEFANPHDSKLRINGVRQSLSTIMYKIRKLVPKEASYELLNSVNILERQFNLAQEAVSNLADANPLEVNKARTMARGEILALDYPIGLVQEVLDKIKTRKKLFWWGGGILGLGLTAFVSSRRKKRKR